MRLRIPLLLVALASLSLAARAQTRTADDFFHGGALSYLSNNIPVALEVVTNGLQRFPDDEKLKKLYALLNQKQQQQQDQKDQKQDQQKDQKQDQKKQDDKKDQKESKEDQRKQDGQKPKPDSAKKDQEQPKPGEGSKDKPEPKPGEPPMAAHAMTPQEAKQLLDAQKNDEQVLIFQPQGKPRNPAKPLKDW